MPPTIVVWFWSFRPLFQFREGFIFIKNKMVGASVKLTIPNLLCYPLAKYELSHICTCILYYTYRRIIFICGITPVKRNTNVIAPNMPTIIRMINFIFSLFSLSVISFLLFVITIQIPIS